MTRVEALAIIAPVFATVVMGLYFFLANYLDEKAAAKELKQKQAAATRDSADLNASFSDLSEAEREQLKLHIETLEGFAETVKTASAAVEESARRVHALVAAERTLESEKR